MKELLIKDSRSDMQLRLSRLVQVPKSEGIFHFDAELSGIGLNAACLVEDYNSQHWSQFFLELSDHWRGWSGEKRHGTYGEMFILSAEADSLGHIALSVSLASDNGPEWFCSAVLWVEAGQLDHIAASASRFFGEAE